MKNLLLMLPILVAMLQTPSPKDPMIAQFEKQVVAVESSLVPDKRLDLFQVQTIQSGSKWDVQGETTVAGARDAVLQAARSAFGTHLGNVDVKLLPDPTLGDKNQALVRVSVAPMRKVPKHAAEMVDQAVMGTLVQLLKAEGGWVLVKTQYEHRYLGWIEKGMLVLMTPAQANEWYATTSTVRPLARYSRLFGTVWAQPDQREPVSDIVLSCILRTGTSENGFTAVTLPDGRTGFVAADSLLPVPSEPRRPTRDEIIRLALQLRGIPYLWGGNSTKGFDCSGFVQTVFRMNGVDLPRDADQQAGEGTAVEPAADFSNVRPGDLLFFGKERITHVGISLGGPRFIHESVDVHTASLGSQDQDFDPGRRDTLKGIRRVLSE